jgi:hypothetical protein
MTVEKTDKQTLPLADLREQLAVFREKLLWARDYL